jgi:phosphohistidine swiveling domain-containing protein
MKYTPIKITIWPRGKKLFKLKKNFLFAGRESSLVRDEVWLNWLMDHGLKLTIRIPNKTIIDYYVDHDSWNSTHKKIADSIIRTWPRHLNRYKELSLKLINASEALAKSAKIKNNDKILRSFLNYTQVAYDFSEYVMGAWSIITHTEKEVVNKLPQYINIINGLEKPVPFQQMQMDLGKYTPDEIVKRYGWLNMYNPFIEPFPKKYFVDQKKRTNKKDLSVLKQSFSINTKKFNDLRKKIKNKNFRSKVEAVHAYAFIKTDRIEVWKKALYNNIPFLSYLAEKMPGASLKDICNMSVAEKIDLLKNGIPPDLKSLKLRSSNNAIIVFRNGQIWEFTKPREVSFIIKSQLFQKRNEIFVTGVNAFPGKAKGRAVIVQFKKDLEKIRKSDILIAKYTMPIYTPYMVKCHGIVTDEGGLTSHAAIFAREHGIPCIVGTKIATKVFKDGDLVEVDADKGIVRKIK